MRPLGMPARFGYVAITPLCCLDIAGRVSTASCAGDNFSRHIDTWRYSELMVR